MRPDREEVDQFQANRQGRNADAPAKKSVANNGGGGSSRFVICLLLIVVLACAAGWFMYQQQQQLQALQQANESASDHINQSKLIMARFEGKLSATGQEVELSDLNTQEKIAFLDSEMRKLWAVSNERNKKWIKDNEAALATLSKTLQASEKTVKAQHSVTEQRQDELQTTLNRLQAKVSALSAESSVLQEDIDTRMSEVQQSLKTNSKVLAEVEDNRAAIAAIDRERQRATERLVDIDRRLNQIQLDIQDLQDKTATGYQIKAPGGAF